MLTANQVGNARIGEVIRRKHNSGVFVRRRRLLRADRREGREEEREKRR